MRTTGGDAVGLCYGEGRISVSGSETTAEPVIGAAGHDTLALSLVSADGHPRTGEIPFQRAPAAKTELATSRAPALTRYLTSAGRFLRLVSTWSMRP